MPSPQSLVAFLVMLFLLLISTRTQFGLSPNIAAGLSLLLALVFAWIVDRNVPPDEDDVEDEEEVEQEDLVVEAGAEEVREPRNER